jgi:hypothetical protein
LLDDEDELEDELEIRIDDLDDEDDEIIDEIELMVRLENETDEHNLLEVLEVVVQEQL